MTNLAARLRRLERARETVAVGKLCGAVGTSAHLSPRVEAGVCKKLGLRPGADRHAGCPARHPRRIHDHAGAGRREHRTLGRRVPPSPAHGSARSRGTVHQGPERQQRHAAQAQSHHLGTPHRPRPRAPRQRRRRAGKRRPLARTRHQPQQRRAHHLPRFLHAARLHVRPAHAADGRPGGLSGEHEDATSA